MARIRLTENFYLDEFTRSDVAARHGIEIVVEPDSPVFYAIKRQCELVLQPLRSRTGRPVLVTSGWRPLAVNRLVGSLDTSGHVLALATDFTVLGMEPLDVCQTIVEEGLPFDQLIHEFGRWVHVSIAANGVPRRELLTALKEDGQTVYKPGLLPVGGP